MGILEKIQAIELEMSRTQKNKATEYHLGLLKGKLARYRQELLAAEQQSSGGGGGQGFEVAKTGDARVCFVGLPSVGKSTLLNLLDSTDIQELEETGEVVMRTDAKEKSATNSYEFTTLVAVAAVLNYQGARIQLVDLPGIIAGASKNMGRGKQVISTAKTADLIVMVLDATKAANQRQVLEKELEAMNIRLNKEKPNIYFKIKSTGGIKYNSVAPAEHLTENVVKMLLKDYRIHNAEVLVRDETCTIDDFIDIIHDQHISYINCLYVYNKIDAVSLEEVDRIAREPNTVVISCEQALGIDDLIDEMWYQLNLVRLYTKKRGVKPDFSDPMVVRQDSSIEDVCKGIHKDFKDQFKYALVWGSSAKHSPQKCGLGHKINDQDVISIFTK